MRGTRRGDLGTAAREKATGAAAGHGRLSGRACHPRFDQAEEPDHRLGHGRGHRLRVVRPRTKKWVLTNATNPLKSGTSAQTVEALKAAETKKLGTGRYVLIGASGWKPENASGAKVAVRGMVIKDTSESRVNVVSFNKVADSCQ